MTKPPTLSPVPQAPNNNYLNALKDIQAILNGGKYRNGKLTDKEKKIITDGFSMMDPLTHVLGLLKIPYNASFKDLKAGTVLAGLMPVLPSGFISALKKSDSAQTTAMNQLKKELGDMYAPASVEALMQLMQSYMINFFLQSLSGHYSSQKDMLDIAIKSGKLDDVNWALESIKSTNGTVFGGGAVDNSLFANGLMSLLSFIQTSKSLAQIQAELNAVNKQSATLEASLKKEKAAFDQAMKKVLMLKSKLTPVEIDSTLWGMN